MTNQLFDDISYLCAQAQLYLLENYSKGDKLFVAPENQHLFRKTQQPQPQQLKLNPTPLPPPPPLPRPTPKKEAIPFPQPEKPAATQSATPTENLQPVTLSERDAETPLPNEEILRGIREMFPHIKILPPPKPEPAPTIALLNLGETSTELEFLHHIAAAICICFGIRCKVINPKIDPLDPAETKLLLGVEYRLTEALQKGAIPLFALPDLSHPMQNAGLKATLWKTITQQISKYVR